MTLACRVLTRVLPVLLTALCVAFAPGIARAVDVPAEVLQAEQERIAAIAKATRSAVAVFANSGEGGGSGVLITPDGYALSNFHVTKPAGDYMKCGLSDGHLYDAVIVGLDPTGDVALIKLLGREDFPAAELGDSDLVRAGDTCFAIGNPFLLATDFQPTVSCGMISGVHRYQFPAGTLLEYADCLQTDAAINPGNSGGPLFNAQGQLIGINGRCSFEKRGRVNVGVGYAISINQIKHFLGDLRSGRIVDHATLGATVSKDEEGRVIVSNILETSDAYRRGLRYGDEIVSFAGREINTVNGFKNVLGIFPRDWRVPLRFLHEGQPRDVLVRLAGVHTRDELLRSIEDAPPIEPKLRPKPKLQPAPKGKPEEPAPDGQPDAPGGDPTPEFHRPVAIPQHVQPLIAKRPGFANFHFNETNRDRVWKAFQAHGDFTGLAGTWRLVGKDDGGGRVEIELAQAKVTGRFPSELAELDPTKDLAEQLLPRNSGGLLAALHLWQRFLRLGPQQFGDVYYLGAAPVRDRPGLCDVVVATHNVVEARFLFDPATGMLVGIEMFPDTDVDPCEVYFADYREVNGRQVPHTLLVRHGDEVFSVIRVETFELAAS